MSNTACTRSIAKPAGIEKQRVAGSPVRCSGQKKLDARMTFHTLKQPRTTRQDKSAIRSGCRRVPPNAGFIGHDFQVRVLTHRNRHREFDSHSIHLNHA
ncbi:hypothetical protein Bxe_B2778 [Paraburkholderia xenovorans LB400]|uniref:Uncharacterized protein n=1 Tax=Paraburkholderia xenovorans (strain LB400) TaxID=266265 RepID=Q13RS2_PARXL|nr:hypothetical protein Bxe_B2778 [Paraburkholderia xenovorans LB400]